MMRIFRHNFIFCFLLIIVLLYTNVFALEFSDVSNEHRNYDAIQYMALKKIVNGYDDGSFRPDSSVTRAELCVICARVAGYEKNSGEYSEELPFIDVTEEYWARDYIDFAYESGIINGMGDGTFSPAGSVTYEQAIKMLTCFVGFDPVENSDFGNEWYSGYLAVANQYNMFKNIDVEIGLEATRADIVQLLYNIYIDDLFGKAAELKEAEQEQNTESNTNEISNNVVYNKIEALDKILIDPGHNYSGADNGARNPSETLFEERITWQISDKLVKKLQDYGFEVYITREKETSSIANTSVTDSLKARVDMAHELDVDLFLSIHCNAGGGTGVETYSYDIEGAGFLLSNLISNSISKATGMYNRGAKTAGYYVIKNTAMPSVLIETGFIDSKKDSMILSSEDGQEIIAQAIADAVQEYYERYVEIDLTEGRRIID